MKKRPISLVLCLIAVGAVLLIGLALSRSKPAAGWHKTDAGMQYQDASGAPVTGWISENETQCYLTEGSHAVGWQQIDGSTYYFQEGGIPVTAPTEIDGVLHLFDENGKVISGWYEEENGRHYADAKGVPAFGWTEIDGTQYYFDEDGVMCTGWIEADNRTRYFREDGSMAKGKVIIDEAAHFFSSTGEEFYLVNPWNRIPENYSVNLAPTEFGHKIAVYAADELSEMLNACRAAGHSPVIRSSYRTMSDQTILYQNKIKRLMNAGYNHDEAAVKAATVVAYPGTSEHQMGLALDIVDSHYRNLDEWQAETATQKWLMENSWKFGFILRYPTDKGAITGIIYEPWHYRYVGKELAAELHELNLCLEEYVNMLTIETA